MLYHLARQGLTVLGLDQYPEAHPFGSSHGQTRIVRQAYFEGPFYVPLLKRSYELWDNLNAIASRDLFIRCGVLQIGAPDGVVVPGVLSSSKLHDLPIEVLSQKRFIIGGRVFTVLKIRLERLNPMQAWFMLRK